MRSRLFALALTVAALAPSTVIAQGGPTSDLRVTGQALPTTVAAGEPLAFRFLIENLGPDAATNVSARFSGGGATVTYNGVPNVVTVGMNPVFVDTSSSWICVVLPPAMGLPNRPSGRICDLPSLAAGASEVIVIRGTVVPGVQGPIFTEMRVTSDSTDPNPGNNDSIRVEAVLGSPALSIPSHSSRTLALLALLLSGVVVRLRHR